MKYTVTKVVNGNYAIVSEHSTAQAAIVAFHDQCKIHWNAPDVLDATIAILDENLDAYNGYKEHIMHEPVAAAVQPEPVEATVQPEESGDE